jgi:hypothetical protein
MHSALAACCVGGLAAQTFPHILVLLLEPKTQQRDYYCAPDKLSI